MKKMIGLLMIFFLVFALGSCNKRDNHKKILEAYSVICYLPLTDYSIEWTENTHGGWLGDGDTIYKLGFSETQADQVKQITENWKTTSCLDDPEELSLFLFGDQNSSQGLLDERICRGEGRFMLYDKKTKLYDSIDFKDASHNFICFFYSQKDNALYVQEFDS